MSEALFQIRTHYVDSSYIRHYPHALSGSQEDTLKLAVKRYTPLNSLQPKAGDVTLIAAHANGVGKELYEPLWDDLLRASERSNGFRIRSIWMADVAWQGESGVLNEDKLGDDPSWFDHPRDLLHFMNVFRKELSRPIVGVGHSMGGSNVINVALMHPRLLDGLILIDPVIQRVLNDMGNLVPAFLSTSRRDIWPSREEAKATFLRNKFYQGWDPRCLDQWVKYGLRTLPTAIYPDSESDASARPVTLTTTKYQEVYTFMRGNYPPSDVPIEHYKPDRQDHPDLQAEYSDRRFYRPESVITFRNLPYLRPRVLYIFASDKSDMSHPDLMHDKLAITGNGVGGSGGEAIGAVQSVDIKDAGHFVPFEKPGEVAQAIERWLSERLSIWKQDEAREREHWAKVPKRQKRTFTEERMFWTEQMKKKLQDQQRAANTTAASTGAKL